MPGVEDDEIELVSQIIIGAYGNMWGKDFAHKRNTWEGASHTQATRATLGTIDYKNNLKKKKWMKEEKKASPKKTNRKKKDTEVDGVNSLMGNVANMCHFFN